eukprot:1156876-Pelagomonas_calceolata.AAC.24
MTVREVPVRCGLGCITFGKGLRPRGILAHADAHRLSSVPAKATGKPTWVRDLWQRVETKGHPGSG